MDVFSATNKQVTQPTIDTSMHTRRSVEKVEQNADVNKKQSLNPKDMKLKLDNTIKHLNEHMKSLDTNIKFGFNDKIDIMFVNVIEKSTGKVIRKIPTEEAMKLSEKMKEIVGMIFDKKG